MTSSIRPIWEGSAKFQSIGEASETAELLALSNALKKKGCLRAHFPAKLSPFSGQAPIFKN